MRASEDLHATFTLQQRMKHWFKHIIHASWTAALSVLLLTACDAIDEDRSDCDKFELNYELRLVTNLTTELNTELTAQADVELASALRNALSYIFTDFAHDVDLSFYDTEGTMMRLQHDEHVMDDNQATYSLNLPARKYMHLAVANIVNNQVVDLTDDDFCMTSRLSQILSATRAVTADTIDSHTTGLFSARLPMDVQTDVDQTFNVHLYMANCAAALVIDPRGQSYKGLKVYTTGFASSFNLADSTFVFDETPPIVRTNHLSNAFDGKLCFYSVNFPSREPKTTEAKGTRTVIETTEPFVSEPDENTLWEIRAYVTLDDGSITETRLGLREPLRAGQLKIVKGYISDDGSIQTDDHEVSTSVQLNWSPGLIIHT